MRAKQAVHGTFGGRAAKMTRSGPVDRGPEYQEFVRPAIPRTQCLQNRLYRPALGPVVIASALYPCIFLPGHNFGVPAGVSEMLDHISAFRYAVHPVPPFRP